MDKIKADKATQEEAEEEKDRKSLKQRVFSSESAYSVVLNKIADIVVIHFMVLLFSVPIITTGAAITAGNYTCMKLAGGMEGYVTSNFMKAFKENFKRSTLYFLVMALSGAVLYISLRYWFYQKSAIGLLFGIFSVVLVIVWMMIFLYLFGVQAKFENTFMATLKNSLLMAVRHLHITILMVLVLAVFTYFVINFSLFQVISAVSGIGILLFIFGKLYNIVFRHYM